MAKNLGKVTAYGYAKLKGYTGTEEEFAQLMANYAFISERAVEAAETATTKANEASSSASDASDSADLALEYARQAEESAGNAGYMNFYINENGNLIYERNTQVDLTFQLIDGDLVLVTNS